MPVCSKCAELDLTVEIRSLGELRKALRGIQDNLADGTLEEVIGPTPPADTTRFPDFVSTGYACRGCSRVFRLDVETYHGRGGTWGPVRYD